MPWALHQIPKSPAESEIQTFCPIRICLGHHIFDALLDSVDGEYGGFYVLTDELAVKDNDNQDRTFLLDAAQAEVIFHQGEKTLSTLCRIQVCWLDPDGLLAYMRVKFLTHQPMRHQWEHWMRMLW